MVLRHFAETVIFDAAIRAKLLQDGHEFRRRINDHQPWCRVLQDSSQFEESAFLSRWSIAGEQANLHAAQGWFQSRECRFNDPGPSSAQSIVDYCPRVFIDIERNQPAGIPFLGVALKRPEENFRTEPLMDARLHNHGRSDQARDHAYRGGRVPS